MSKLWFIVFLFSPVLSNDQQKRKIKVAAFDYHGVLVTVHWKDLAWCSGKIAARNLDDVSNMMCSGVKIGVKKYVYNQDLNLKSILEDDPSLMKYEDDIYECIDVLEQPNKEMIDLLKELKQQGVVLVLASNMDENSFELNKSKIKPELFNLFDIYHIANNQNGRKPDPEYFKNMVQKIEENACQNNEECKQNLEIDCVFTDDLQENIQGAEKADLGIKSFHFNSSTKVNKFRKKLIRFEFLKKFEEKTD